MAWCYKRKKRVEVLRVWDDEVCRKEGKKEVWEPNESTMRWLKVEVRKSHPTPDRKERPAKAGRQHREKQPLNILVNKSFCALQSSSCVESSPWVLLLSFLLLYFRLSISLFHPPVINTTTTTTIAATSLLSPSIISQRWGEIKASLPREDTSK